MAEGSEARTLRAWRGRRALRKGRTRRCTRGSKLQSCEVVAVAEGSETGARRRRGSLGAGRGRRPELEGVDMSTSREGGVSACACRCATEELDAGLNVALLLAGERVPQLLTLLGRQPTARATVAVMRGGAGVGVTSGSARTAFSTPTTTLTFEGD
jgi:hypothetical protein